MLKRKETCRTLSPMHLSLGAPGIVLYGVLIFILFKHNKGTEELSYNTFCSPAAMHQSVQDATACLYNRIRTTIKAYIYSMEQIDSGTNTRKKRGQRRVFLSSKGTCWMCDKMRWSSGLRVAHSKQERSGVQFPASLYSAINMSSVGLSK